MTVAEYNAYILSVDGMEQSELWMTIYIQELETVNVKHCVSSYPNLQKKV